MSDGGGRDRAVRWWWYGAAVVVLTVVGIVATVASPPRGFLWQLVWGGSAWFVLNVAQLAAVRVRERGKLWWTTFGFSLAAMGLWTTFGICEVSVNFNQPWDRVIGAVWGSVVIIAFYLVALVMLRGSARDGGHTRRVRRGARAAATLLLLGWLTILVLAQVEVFASDRVLLMAVGPPLVLLAGAVLWLPAATSLDAQACPQSLAGEAAMLGHCPRCGREQRFPAGGSACGGCGLRVNLEFEEPRCACGYLLYKLAGDRCPECGRIIGEDAVV